MSQITLLYDEYVKNGAEEATEKGVAMDAIAEMLPTKDYAKFEETINRAEDKMTEGAFRAGFKAAMLLIKEALS